MFLLTRLHAYKQGFWWRDSQHLKFILPYIVIYVQYSGHKKYFGRLSRSYHCMDLIALYNKISNKVANAKASFCESTCDNQKVFNATLILILKNKSVAHKLNIQLWPKLTSNFKNFFIQIYY